MLPRNIENKLNQDMKMNVSVERDVCLILKREKTVCTQFDKNVEMLN